MQRYLLILLSLLAATQVAAQEPLYIVNGEPRDQIRNIPPDQIERVESLPADEESIAIYGQGAAHGVIIVTLRFDQPARFRGEGSFTDYIISKVDWPESETAARVVIRYKIGADGLLRLDKELESTDNRLRRRVLKAVEQAPQWHPATQRGAPVETEVILNIQLPLGRELPRKVELVWR